MSKKILREEEARFLAVQIAKQHQDLSCLLLRLTSETGYRWLTVLEDLQQHQMQVSKKANERDAQSMRDERLSAVNKKRPRYMRDVTQQVR